jgi:hypothetical protein
LVLEKKIDRGNMLREVPNLSGAVLQVECTTQRIRTWRESIGQTAQFLLHPTTDIKRAMVAEIAELRAILLTQCGNEVLDIAKVAIESGCEPMA